MDKNFNQTAYYRLKQLDFDGKYAYSSSIALQKIGEKARVKIYPNPVSNQSFLSIDFSENNQKNTHIAIFESNGRLIYQNTIGQSVVKIPVTDWLNGLYLIRLTSEDGKTTVSKLVKN